MTLEEQDGALGPERSPALAADVHAARGRYRELLERLDAQLDEPGPPVSTAAYVALAAQLALAHAVELASLLHGESLEAKAAALVDAVWDAVRLDVARESCARSIRAGWSASLADMLEECDLDEQVPPRAAMALAAILAAGLVQAQVEPEHWQLREMARTVTRQSLQSHVAGRRDEAMAHWFASFGRVRPR
ncbi:hypothetical protein [Nonomuraea aridisoli]|uniref:Uncharacterized protein n=1 Tax=Nonomuraea aridisoli TaxID=2070368 RepID=A0A2W2EDL2_9ACTN|nr:hypothetical protein [Nonomuraea aridisoli]PZG10088.1 hypothetical protein C1J01_36765 [Nonomuraea aridisoli]